MKRPEQATPQRRQVGGGQEVGRGDGESLLRGTGLLLGPVKILWNLGVMMVHIFAKLLTTTEVYALKSELYTI